jgi:hypothetical protein
LGTRKKEKKKGYFFHFIFLKERKKIPAATWLVTFISHELDAARVYRDLQDCTTAANYPEKKDRHILFLSLAPIETKSFTK